MTVQGERTALGPVPTDGVVTVDLPARVVVLLELSPGQDAVRDAR